MTEREKLIEAMAQVIYNDLEGPITSQDFMRQIRQWDRAQKLATAALSAIEASGAVVVMSGQCSHSGVCKAAQEEPS